MLTSLQNKTDLVSSLNCIDVFRVVIYMNTLQGMCWLVYVNYTQAWVIREEGVSIEKKMPM